MNSRPVKAHRGNLVAHYLVICGPILPVSSQQKFSGTKVCTGDFAPPEPEFRPEFCETNFGRPNSGPEFLGRIFWLCFLQQKRPPEKFTLEKFTSQNSPSKIQPRNRTKKFTLHLCRAVWLKSSAILGPENGRVWLKMAEFEGFWLKIAEFGGVLAEHG